MEVETYTGWVRQPLGNDAPDYTISLSTADTQLQHRHYLGDVNAVGVRYTLFS